MLETLSHTNPDGDTVKVTVSGRVKIGRDVTLGKNVFLWQNTEIGNGTTIGDYCQFGYDVSIGANSTIGHHSNISWMTIGDQVYCEGKLTNSMYSKIGDNVQIKWSCFLGPSVIVEEGVHIGSHFTTVSYTTIGKDSWIGDYVHLDRDITIGERVVIEKGVSLFGKQTIHNDRRIIIGKPRIRIK